MELVQLDRGTYKNRKISNTHFSTSNCKTLAEKKLGIETVRRKFLAFCIELIELIMC